MTLSHPKLYNEYEEYMKNTQLLVIGRGKYYNDTFDMLHYFDINHIDKQYVFKMKVEMEYGKIYTIESRIKFSSPDIGKVLQGIISRSWDEYYVDILNEDEYLMMINGYLRSILPLFPMEIGNICYEYYYPYVVVYEYQDRVHKSVLNAGSVYKYQKMTESEHIKEMIQKLELDESESSKDFDIKNWRNVRYKWPKIMTTRCRIDQSDSL